MISSSINILLPALYKADRLTALLEEMVQFLLGLFIHI
jgi:hypothetical protein